MNTQDLIKLAIKAKEEMTYAPYSKFRVGACVEMEDGSVYSGGNIEIASYSATNCAERTAIFKAVSEGKRSIVKIAIAADSKDVFPCGICRQVIREFGDNTKIIIANSENDYKTYTIEELLPHSFNKKDLGVSDNV
ncbi:cytidine deaminase [Peptoniphilus catoniae]|uniref:cytidine deaminase n=1 Tax=Peptoniphilus catoniae TaxID=1660341 RepID=UPI0010FD38B0|nr:cytidine deaminase [Peptoniphilus catoniae]